MAPSMTYPVKHLEGDLTPEQIHLILRTPNVIAKRVATLAEQRFIADYLLTGRFNAAGGGIYYETGEEIFPPDSIQAVAPGGEYPMTIIGEGEMAAARVTKWGLGSKITDEKISREGMVYVNRVLGRLVNGTVRDVDGVAMAVIGSKVTNTFSSKKEWKTPGAIAQALKAAQNQQADLGTGLELDTVVLTGDQWADIVGMLIDEKALPREAGNPVINGYAPVEALGFTWTTSPKWTSDRPLFVDRDNLGGMADENLNSPGWTSAGQQGVQTSPTRDDAHDQYQVRSRRVTVPVVTDGLAGLLMEGTGL